MSDILKRTTLTPGNKCLLCGHHLDASTAMNGEEDAKEGDLSVCIKCADVAVFTADLGLRPMEEGEWLAVDENVKAEIGRARLAIQQLNFEANAKMFGSTKSKLH